MINQDLLSRLSGAGLLSKEAEVLDQVSTGSYALNKVVSGSYTGGIPVGGITQFIGDSSTAKTVFVTHILREAQVKGYYTILIDSENAYNSKFASSLGLDPGKLIYAAPETLEDCFETMESLIKQIRETDKDTPIVIGYDSIAVSPVRSEYNAENYDRNNMQGAQRAMVMGSCLRSINPRLRRDNVALVVVNQLRTKVGQMYGDPNTAAAGGRSLDYYLMVNLKTLSAKSERIEDENKQVIGISGRVKNQKNKLTVPFQECEFKLLFDQGLTAHYGLLDSFVRAGVVTKSGAWYQYKEGTKFQKKTFEEGIGTPEFAWIEEEINNG